MLTLVIPVRHPKNAKNWPQLKARLSQTMAAIARQEQGDWRGVVVANNDADLPSLPPGFEVKRVDFPPNPLYELGQNDREAFFEAARLDKGRRILAGMLHAREADYFMVVDDDDFISCKLAGFVAAHHGEAGWCFTRGYVWPNGGHVLYQHPSFHKTCGTSHIIRADLLELPTQFEQATDLYIKRMLGSHIFIDDYLRDKGTPLAPLPFCGAVYRIGHEGNHSKSSRLLRTFVFKKKFIMRPWSIVGAALRLRPLTGSIRQEFFGSQSA